jgi:hypothetical protein
MGLGKSEHTLLIQRSIALGEEANTKTRHHRTVRRHGAWLLTNAGLPAAPDS